MKCTCHNTCTLEHKRFSKMIVCVTFIPLGHMWEPTQMVNNSTHIPGWWKLGSISLALNRAMSESCLARSAALTACSALALALAILQYNQVVPCQRNKVFNTTARTSPTNTSYIWNLIVLVIDVFSGVNLLGFLCFIYNKERRTVQCAPVLM